MDPQVPFIPSVEVLVKALLIMSLAAMKLDPDSFVKIILCSHHPCIVGSAKRDVVWKVLIYILVCSLILSHGIHVIVFLLTIVLFSFF